MESDRLAGCWCSGCTAPVHPLLHAAGRLEEAVPAHARAAGFPALAQSAGYNLACAHALLGAKAS